MTTLHLSVKGEYFHKIKDGTKPWEYRLCTPYWAKRLVGRSYDLVEIAWGYPKAGDTERRVSCPWQGYEIRTIQHPHFGSDPVTVFAINVKGSK